MKVVELDHSKHLPYFSSVNAPFTLFRNVYVRKLGTRKDCESVDTEVVKNLQKVLISRQKTPYERRVMTIITE